MKRKVLSWAAPLMLGCLALLGCGAGALATLDPGSGPVPFVLESAAGEDGGALPAEYTCDGAGVSPPLAWSGAPAGTKEFALLMTTLPGDGTSKWNWVLYRILSTCFLLPRGASEVGIAGLGSHGDVTGYEPPCSQGPGPKSYTFTLYALSAPPLLPDDPADVTGEVLTQALAPVTLATASLTLSYARPR